MPEATRVQDARAREIALRIEQRQRALIPADDAMTALREVRDHSRREITAVAARLDPSIRAAFEAEAAGAVLAIDAAFRAATDVVRSGRDLPNFGDRP